MVVAFVAVAVVALEIARVVLLTAVVLEVERLLRGCITSSIKRTVVTISVVLGCFIIERAFYD